MPQIQLIPRSAMEGMPWWKVLNASEQRAVLVATQALSEEMEKYGLSKLAIGRELVKLREILEPKKKFCDYLRRNFPTCSLATAYRWIENYETAKERLPDSFMRVAMAQGYHVIDAEMLEKLPPPKTQNRGKIIAYLAQLRSARKTQKAMTEEADVNPQVLLRECVNLVYSRYKRLPNNTRARAHWVESLFGMLLSEFGFSEEQTFTPHFVPDGFRVVRGRPRNIA